jgi:hypothetical protein
VVKDDALSRRSRGFESRTPYQFYVGRSPNWDGTSLAPRNNEGSNPLWSTNLLYLARLMVGLTLDRRAIVVRVHGEVPTFDLKLNGAARLS